MRKAVVVIGLAVTCAAIGIGARSLAMWLFTYNATNSLPHGIYMRAFGKPGIGSILWHRIPDSLSAYVGKYYPGELAWLDHPRNGFLKPIVAVAGDTICRDKNGVFSVNGKPLGIALKRDARGNPLPSWRGCRRLDVMQVAVFSDYDRGSLDSRYSGPIQLSDHPVTYRPFITWEAKR